MGMIIRLDRVLADRKMQLSELAEKIDVSIINLSKMKNGKIRAVRFSTLEGICRVLKCQPGDILEYVESETVMDEDDDNVKY
ncbi:MAG: helix-turn-helix domain-containing protein [Mobilitalea sp.]